MVEHLLPEDPGKGHENIFKYYVFQCQANDCNINLGTKFIAVIITWKGGELTNQGHWFQSLLIADDKIADGFKAHLSPLKRHSNPKPFSHLSKHCSN